MPLKDGTETDISLFRVREVINQLNRTRKTKGNRNPISINFQPYFLNPYFPFGENIDEMVIINKETAKRSE